MSKTKTAPLSKEEFLAKLKKLNVKLTSQQLLAALSLAGQIALHQPTQAGKIAQVYAKEQQPEQDALATEVSQEEHNEILAKMVGMVNRPPGHLAKDEELYLEQQLSDIFGFDVTAELDGHRLNHSLGIMGGEQHLKRFAGDDLSQHDAYLEAGMAPGRSAFGWFTENGQLTQEAIQREKYYFAVQTLYLPDWNTSHKDLKPWFKYRKMIMINPAESMAVVGIVGDAGPAQWVKKQFGGSPEVIREGKVWSPKSKGRVILWFVDDPENKIPLGPIDLSWEALQQAEASQNG